MNKRGFTLIELIVTIAILAGLSTIAIGSYYSYAKKARDKSFIMAEKTFVNNAKNAYADCLNNANNDFCLNHDKFGYQNETIYLYDLIENGYSDKIKNPYDPDTVCDERLSYVDVIGNIASGNNKDAEYVVCLVCGNVKSKSCIDSTIEKKADTVTLTEKIATYTGSPIKANTASSTSGTRINYTYYSGFDCKGPALSGGAPTDVGDYSVEAVSSGNVNYNSGSICVKHIIKKGTPTISLNEKITVETGEKILANTATANKPNGDSISLRYTYTYYTDSSCRNELTGIATANDSHINAPSSPGTYYAKATSLETDNLNSASSDCVKHEILPANNLISLSVTGLSGTDYSISPTFSATNQVYSVTVEESSVIINAEPEYGTATVTGTGSKTLSWGSNTASVSVTSLSGDIKVYKIIITDQRPTAPTITGGSEEEVTEPTTITVVTAGTAISGVKEYEYYKSTLSTTPSDSTEAADITLGNLTISDEGTIYIWYRTVSNNGLKSSWSNSQVSVYKKPPSYYTVYFNANGGTCDTSSKNVKNESTYGQLPTAARSGYTFLGWYTSDGTQITSSTQVTITSDQTLYAHWKENNYIVTFNANSGTCDTPSIDVTYGSTYGELPTAIRSGYTFLGWYTAKSGGTKITETSKVTITSNQTLYAHWKNLTFTIEGGIHDYKSACYYIYKYRYGKKFSYGNYKNCQIQSGYNCNVECSGCGHGTCDNMSWNASYGWGQFVLSDDGSYWEIWFQAYCKAKVQCEQYVVE